MSELIFALCLVIGYFLGTVPTGYLIARARGVDIQKIGSGNIGATNVLRSVGTLPALIVVIADPLKGALAVSLPIALGVSSWGVALVGLATVLGNNFNIFLHLKGGKGIATSMGVFLVLAPAATLAAVAIGLFTMIVGRYVSLGSLVGMVSAPLFLISGSWSPASLFLAVAMALLALFRHRQNLVRLAQGTERRLGDKAAAKTVTVPPAVSGPHPHKPRPDVKADVKAYAEPGGAPDLEGVKRND